jgi:excinuclease ABC subunit C
MGIAKRLEGFFLSNDHTFISEQTFWTFRSYQQMRNETHRFGISHHRNKRSKQAD